MPARTIHCLDCGAPRHTVYKNTRYCLACRMLRDLAWLEPEERKCRSDNCDAAFLPLGRKDLYCGSCAGLMSSDHGHCGYCKQDDVPLLRGLAICTSCARDAGKRARVMKGLLSGQQKRRAEFGWSKSAGSTYEEVEI